VITKDAVKPSLEMKVGAVFADDLRFEQGSQRF
jgi:hypothetical protein